MRIQKIWPNVPRSLWVLLMIPLRLSSNLEVIVPGSIVVASYSLRIAPFRDRLLSHLTCISVSRPISRGMLAHSIAAQLRRIAAWQLLLQSLHDLRIVFDITHPNRRAVRSLVRRMRGRTTPDTYTLIHALVVALSRRITARPTAPHPGSVLRCSDILRVLLPRNRCHSLK